MLETSARLLRLLSLLQARRDWSGGELADRLGVSPRTVRRDVDRLRELGYPVHGATGVTGGYRLGAGAALPPLLLDDDEAVAVAVGLRSAAGGAIEGIEETSLRALAKLEQVLPARLRPRLSALSAATVAVPGAGPRVDAQVLSVLAAACRDRQVLRFDYRNHGGETSIRRTEPYRLVAWGRRWYLVAYDTDRGDWRTFRVDRIAPRTPTGPRFAPRQPPADDIAGYVSRRASAAVWRHQARIRVHASAEAVADRVGTAAGVVTPVDEHTCLLDTGADSLEAMAVWLGMLGVDFDVAEPPELVAHLAALSDRYRRAAQTGGAPAGALVT
jgi:predicted DNA-binding transcriptional regulator YafY